MKELRKQQIKYFEANINRLVVDADTHITNIKRMHPALKQRLEEEPNYYHGRPICAEDLLKEMKMSGVDVSLIWQNPASTFYPGDADANYHALLAANRYIFEVSQNYPEKFIPAGWTDPRALGLERALELIELCVKEFGFPIVKINPAQNHFPIDSKEVFILVDRIVSLGAIPAFHFGADTEFTPPEGLVNLAQEFPNSPIFAIHMGGGGAGYIEAENHYVKARALGLNYPNIKYILSAKRDTHIESDLITYELAGEPYSKNICCASDAPYGRQAWNFGGFRAMFAGLKNGAEHTDERLNNNPGLFNDDAVTNYMGRNFLQIVLEAYRRIV